ncbi:MAG: energy transducer TonB [bacterium]
MGFVGSLIIHSAFLFLSSFIILNREIKEERIIEVSLVSIPEAPRREIFPIQRKATRGPVRPSAKSEAIPSRFKPKRLIPEEMSSKKGKVEEVLPWKPVRPNLDIANTYGEIFTGTGTKGDVGIGEGKGEGGGEGGKEEGRGGPYTLEITGEVARRAIFYQEGFKIPEWLEKKGISLEGSFKFWVLPDGSVDRATILYSFGYRELDSLAINSILRWRFASLREGKYEEWGIARIKIRLK